MWRPFAGEEDIPAIVTLRRLIAAARPAYIPVVEAEVREHYLKPVPGWRRGVFLEVDAESATGANRLYPRLGFRVETVTIDNWKRLGAPA